MRPFIAFIGIFTSATMYFQLGTSSQNQNLFIYPPDYVKADAPRYNQSATPFSVAVHMEFWAINGVSLRKQDLEVDLTLTLKWSDPRLTLSGNISSQNRWPVLSEHEISKIWTPTLLFRNCKGCAPVSLSKERVLYVNRADGRIMGQVRILSHFTCAIDLRAFPMDIQFCQIQLYTFEDTDDVLMLVHEYPNTAVSIDSNLSLAEYYIVPIVRKRCVVKDADGDAFSCLEFNIRLEHLIGFHMMTLYAPTAFIVILSWISFWLPVDLAPARVALGLTSLLTLATRLDQAQKDLPPVAYVKAIDVWMFACIFLVSVSLCEFAVAHYTSQQDKTRRAVSTSHKVQAVTVKSNAAPCNGGASPPPAGHHDKYSSFDRISRVLFPAAFLIFNVAYWSHYTTYYY